MYSGSKNHLSKGFPTIWGREKGANRRLRPLLHVTSLKGKVVLDLGCGFGVYGELAFEMGSKSIVGFDLVKDYFAKTKGIEYIQGDACNLPFANSTFDVIFLIEVLEHLPHPEKSLQEIRRVSKKSSLLLISVPNKFYPFETHGFHGFEVETISIPGVGIPLLSWAPQFLRSHVERAHIYTAKSLIRLLNDAGFRVYAIDYMMPPMDFCDKVKNAKLVGPLRSIVQKFETRAFLKNFGVSVIAVCSSKTPTSKASA